MIALYELCFNIYWSENDEMKMISNYLKIFNAKSSNQGLLTEAVMF